MYRYFKIIAGVGNGSYIYYWQSKGLSDERINSITASNYSVTPFLDYYGTKTRVEFSGSCLKQDQVTFNHKKVVTGFDGTGFDRHGSFSFPGTGLGRNVIIFGVDMSSSTKIDNRKKDILILGKDPTHLSLHYNRTNSYLFVNGKEILKFKAKDSKVISTPLCLGNISKDWSVDNMKKTGLNGYVYDFSVDYDAIAVDDILDIHNYLMKKNDIV